MILKFFTPTLLAYACFVYRKSEKTKKSRFLIALNFCIAFLIGACWGYKTSALMVLMPALVILYWKMTWRQLMAFSVAAFTVVYLSFVVFDRTNEDPGVIVNKLFTRATVIQGDVSWSIWDTYTSRVDFPEYRKTLLPVFGDKVFALLAGVNKTNYSEWVDYHFDLLLTHLVGYPLDIIERGHNIIGTPFSEGIIALGFPAYLLFAVLGGIVVGLNYKAIRKALHWDKPVLGALASTYFCFVTFSWLNGGSIIQLFHISVLIGYVLSFLLLKVVSVSWTIQRNQISSE